MTKKSDKLTTQRKAPTSDLSAGDDAAVRLIFTKHRTYALPADQPGIPVRDYFPGAELPGPLADAKIYETSDGPVMAIPEAALSETSQRPTTMKKHRGRRPGLE
jgi:hypothetical protein